METIFEFLLKASAGMILFFLVYWFSLRKETFYNANRWYLVSTLLAAILIPVFPLKYEVLVEVENQKQVLKTISDTFKNIPVVSGEETMESGFYWQQIVLIIYLTGAAIFLLRLLTQTFILVHQMFKYKIKSLDGVKIVENEKYGLPFSFFNIVFINPKFHTQDDLPEILAHEKVHIRENHWFDLLFIELLTVIFWFNPFIWFFEHAIKQNHEYLADKGVLAQGHHAARYQALLVNQLMGMQIIGVTNNLNFALNTNRLKMMTKKKTSAKRLIRFSLTLPVLAILIYAFAQPQYRAKDVEPRGAEVLLNVTNAEKTLKISGKVIMKETGEPLPGAAIVIKGSTVGTVVDIDGSFNLVDPNPEVENDGGLKTTLVVSFVGLRTIEKTVGISGQNLKNQENINVVFKMEDLVGKLYNKNYSGEQFAPPPPPPPPQIKELPRSANGGEEVFFIVENWPKYPDGWEAMQDYITKMQQKIAQAKGIKGKAKVLFTVNAKGKVTDIKVIEKDNDGAAKGAVTLVSGMPDWTPGKQRGKPVPVKYMLPLEFK